jgi:hypothetical protein
MDSQHPKVTLGWALHSLERALEHLEDGWAERRVRRQFHQLLLALERDALFSQQREAGRPLAHEPGRESATIGSRQPTVCHE